MLAMKCVVKRQHQHHRAALKKLIRAASLQLKIMESSVESYHVCIFLYTFFEGSTSFHMDAVIDDNSYVLGSTSFLSLPKGLPPSRVKLYICWMKQYNPLNEKDSGIDGRASMSKLCQKRIQMRLLNNQKKHIFSVPSSSCGHFPPTHHENEYYM